MEVDIELQYDKIYRFCFMKLHDPQAAEDVTQDTFLHFLKARQERVIKNETAYLYRIARNLCTDFYRHIPVIPMEEIEGTYEDDLKISDMRIVLEQAMEILPCDEREIIFLRYINEIPIKEIVRILDISRFAIYRKEQHALKLLREQMERGDFL